MKTSVSQVISIFLMIPPTVSRWLGQFILNVKSSLVTYKEIVRTGEIKSSADGEKVVLNIQANVCGDILIFIEPKNAGSRSVAEVLELVDTDIALHQQKELAMQSLHAKFRGIMVIPQLLAWLITILFFYYSYSYIYYMYRLSGGSADLNIAQKILPLILPGIAILYGRAIGFKLISYIIRLTGITRWIWMRLTGKLFHGE